MSADNVPVKRSAGGASPSAASGGVGKASSPTAASSPSPSPSPSLWTPLRTLLVGGHSMWVVWFLYTAMQAWGDDDINVAKYSALLLASVYYPIRSFLRWKILASRGKGAEWDADCEKEHEKARSWILGALAALPLSISGIYNMKIAIEGGNEAVVRLSEMDFAYSRELIIFYTVEMALDLGFGAMDYPGQMSPLTAYLHHTMYLLIATWLVENKITCGIGVVFNNEIPTLILALGTLHKGWRNDEAFGITFFIFRIVYDIWIFYVHIFHSPVSQ
jgi:hypothetical protein